ncbi:UNVERIFIED_CONTAM: hypothetical protein GTU68_046599, partial [Idotea baltica]|nr:hypothetical protein [Idotea baltica]
MIGGNRLVQVGAKTDIADRPEESSPAIDSNKNKMSSSNSKGEEKYGLRPRTLIKRLQQERTRQEVPKKAQRSK